MRQVLENAKTPKPNIARDNGNSDDGQYGYLKEFTSIVEDGNYYRSIQKL